MAKHRTRARVVLLMTGILAVVVVAAVVRYRGELVAWYVFRRDFEGLGKNEQGYPEYRHRQTGIVFVRLPGGRFSMGSPDSETDHLDDEGPVHEATISPFLIAKCEVSQAEWTSAMSNYPSKSRGDSLPVEQVSWDDCQEFCEKSGLSIPTEAQWEYACRVGGSRPFAFGENITTYQVNYKGAFPFAGASRGEDRGRTVPVGSFGPNGFGLHDMHGNVWEWCRDWYQEDYYKESAGARDPLCVNASSEYRVFRGGAWSSDGGNCRSAYRGMTFPSTRSGNLGFRPAAPSP